jgi:hypothetical protein
MNITIDGQVFNLDTFSEEAKAQVASVQAADIKLNELRRDTAITMTARNSYMQALKKELERLNPVSPQAAQAPTVDQARAVAEKPKSRTKSSNSEA